MELIIGLSRDPAFEHTGDRPQGPSHRLPKALYGGRSPEEDRSKTTDRSCSPLALETDQAGAAPLPRTRTSGARERVPLRGIEKRSHVAVPSAATFATEYLDDVTAQLNPQDVRA